MKHPLVLLPDERRRYRRHQFWTDHGIFRDRFSVAESRQASLQSSEPCAPCGKSRCPLPEAKKGLILCQQALRPELVWTALSPLLEHRS